jgi:hypothetical protein
MQGKQCAEVEVRWESSLSRQRQRYAGERSMQRWICIAGKFYQQCGKEKYAWEISVQK